MEKKHLLIVAMLAPLMMSCGLAMDIYVPCIPFMPTALNTSEIMVQWTLSIFMIGVGIGQFVGGTFSDIHGRRKTMLISIVVYTVSSILCSLAIFAWHLLLARAIQSLAASGCLVTCNAIVRDCVDSQKSARVYSMINGMNSLAPLLAPKLGGYLYTTTGMWQSTFIFLVVFGVIETVIVSLFLRETLSAENKVNKRGDKRNWFYEQKIFISNVNFMISTFSGMLAMTSLFAFFSLSPILLIGKLDLSVSDFAYYFGINALMFLMATVICTLSQNILSTLDALRVGIVILMISSCLMFIISKIYDLEVIYFMVPAVAMTFGAGFIFGPAISVAMEPFGACAGNAAAMYGAIQYIVAAIIGSFIVHYTHNSADIFGLTIFLLSVPLLLSSSFLVKLNRMDKKVKA